MSDSTTSSIETPQRILVVDDEGIVLVALREILLREGYHVLTHSNPLQAIESLKKETFSVILTDQQMPVLTGLEFLAQAKILQPDATRILITAVLSLDTVIDAINKGEIYRFIVKPWLREELISIVKNAVHRYETTCRNHILQASALTMNEQITQLKSKLSEAKAEAEHQKQELDRVQTQSTNHILQPALLCHRILHAYSHFLGYQALRTQAICRAMADHLHLGEDQKCQLEAAALVSNIGFISLPHALVRKNAESPGQLTADQQKHIEQHPILGASILEGTPAFAPIVEIVREHHERFDGWGYPQRLTAEHIPLLTSLLEVAVAAAEAPNQGEASYKLIQTGSGTAFHPEAVRAFLSVYPGIVKARNPKEIRLSDLHPGMILAKDIYASGGILLLPEGQQLTETHIGDLQERQQKDNLQPHLLVTC